MHLYTLDSQLRRDTIVDQFESLIWTERRSEMGDFELVIHSTHQSRSIFKTGVLLAHDGSYRVMKVETVEDKTDEEGRQILTVQGRSLEEILDSRVAKDVLDDLTTAPRWIITDAPADVARKIFHDICVTGTLSLADKIPFIFEGSTFLPADTIDEPIDDITVEIEPATVYTAIKNICDVWNLGFRLIRQLDLSKLWFDIYTGSDRTTSQTTLPAVVFAEELDNLQNTTELTSIALVKTVAYVFSPAGFQEVYPLDSDTTATGFQRRVLVVNASDITDENPDVTAALIQRGREELAKNRLVQAFDGEINPNSKYKYGRDYNLGDLVEKRNSDGSMNIMRVTEQIFVSDREGDRSYPTLALNTFVTPGSWLSWKANEEWDDQASDEYWADQP